MTVIALQSSTFLFVSGLGLLTSGRAWDPMRTMFEDSAAGRARADRGPRLARAQ